MTAVRELADMRARREMNTELASLRQQLGRPPTADEVEAIRARCPAPPAPYRSLLNGPDPDLQRMLEQAHAATKLHMAEQEALRERQAAATETRRVAEQQQARLARLRTAGIPEDHVRVLTSAGLDKSGDAMQRVVRWRKGDRRVLVLAGAVGRGKSLAACWLLAMGPRRPYPHPGGYDTTWPAELAPRFVAARRLARLDTYRSRELDVLERCSVLVVDEVGGGDVGSASSWAERLDSLVSARYDAALDTILTTNLGRDEFREAFGERLFDRVSGSAGTWEEFAGPSLRQGGGR